MSKEQDQIDHDATMLSYAFISEVEKYLEKHSMNRADLAELLSTSKSYLTQLWRGDKLLNMKMIARIQIALNIKFRVTKNHQP